VSPSSGHTVGRMSTRESEARPASTLAGLLDGIIDYAGLFPPASLTLQPALSRFAAYYSGSDAHMLRSFVAPSGIVDRILECLDSVTGDALPFTVLTSHHDSEGPPGRHSDASASRRLRERGHPILSFESKMPTNGCSATELSERLRVQYDVLCDPDEPSLPILFVEPPPDGEAVAMAAEVGAGLRDSGLPVGLKIRTGGTAAAAYPSADAVAGFILECSSRGVPFKATAGLHHPLAHYDPVMGVWSHGFLNLFVGAAVVFNGQRDPDTLSELMRDPDPGSFQFGDHEVTWRSESVSRDVVAQSRRRLAISVGSCSFAEPLDDLRALGLLPTTPKT